ncbi:unnamed protein product [Symbiodinium natans]|uniref:Uncharacterized protein n=1 Tax=Symbiodinium natans TaxID=878477 RepID=A0A812TL00_9DINO|nr:unnamed protein product [Symbiodinium natans]
MHEAINAGTWYRGEPEPLGQREAGFAARPPPHCGQRLACKDAGRGARLLSYAHLQPKAPSAAVACDAAALQVAVVGCTAQAKALAESVKTACDSSSYSDRRVSAHPEPCAAKALL